MQICENQDFFIFFKKGGLLEIFKDFKQKSNELLMSGVFLITSKKEFF